MWRHWVPCLCFYFNLAWVLAYSLFAKVNLAPLLLETLCKWHYQKCSFFVESWKFIYDSSSHTSTGIILHMHSYNLVAVCCSCGCTCWERMFEGIFSIDVSTKGEHDYFRDFFEKVLGDGKKLCFGSSKLSHEVPLCPNPCESFFAGVTKCDNYWFWSYSYLSRS